MYMYSIAEAQQERANDIMLAVEGRDASLLNYFAELEMREGNEEYASSLRQLATRVKGEALRREELEAEKAERQAEYYEAWTHPSEGNYYGE